MALNVTCGNATIPSLSGGKRTHRDYRQSVARDPQRSFGGPYRLLPPGPDQTSRDLGAAVLAPPLFRSGLHERQLRAVAFKQKTSEHRSMLLMTVINHSLRGTAHVATLRATGSTN